MCINKLYILHLLYVAMPVDDSAMMTLIASSFNPTTFGENACSISSYFIRTDLTLKIDIIFLLFLKDEHSSVEFVVRHWEPLTITRKSNRWKADLIIQSICWRRVIDGASMSSLNKYWHLFKRHPRNHSSHKHMLHFHVSTPDQSPSSGITIKGTFQFAHFSVPLLTDWQELIRGLAPQFDYFTKSQFHQFRFFVCLHKCGVVFERDTKTRVPQVKVEVERSKIHFAGLNQLLVCMDALNLDYGDSSRLTVKSFLFERILYRCRVEVGEMSATIFTDDLPMLVAEASKLAACLASPKNKDTATLSKIACDPEVPTVDLCSFGFTEYEIHDLLQAGNLSVSGISDSSKTTQYTAHVSLCVDQIPPLISVDEDGAYDADYSNYSDDDFSALELLTHCNDQVSQICLVYCRSA